MKNLTLILFLVSTLICFSQEKKKETVFILFNAISNEKCKVPVEGKGYKKLNKFRKEYEDYGNIINFKICNETFSFNKTKSVKDTCSVKILNKLKIVDLEYVINKKNKNILKYNPFDKIYIEEKISNNKIIKYGVVWIDEWLIIED
ncbi:hypothetical protein IZU89_11485 [Cellulophaga lytica]|uniref:Lipoprotein n=1 Tax=Cellulophaga geojensis KL-A TaxID=1328323 RepID=A0ABN0RSK2_9FLAO|nr:MULTISPECIES: hypothetical protein [Cellulophaga]AIM61049.1 hypothetical protein IX49_11135 [Cellulophaga lytica]EWH14894.1 hypothetical protein KLA_00005 [Cellulophaga geojensis KL-A]SNQ43650.1 conserved exported hypothetical protein [Cellulophaga lytica]